MAEEMQSVGSPYFRLKQSRDDGGTLSAMVKYRCAREFARARTLVVGVPLGLMAFVRSSNASARYEPVAQPIPFDHQIHAGRLGINCVYCHATVMRSPTAGIPPTQTCVPCHSTVWINTRELAPVRRSIRPASRSHGTASTDCPTLSTSTIRCTSTRAWAVRVVMAASIRCRPSIRPSR